MSGTSFDTALNESSRFVEEVVEERQDNLKERHGSELSNREVGATSLTDLAVAEQEQIKSVSADNQVFQSELEYADYLFDEPSGGASTDLHAHHTTLQPNAQSDPSLSSTDTSLEALSLPSVANPTGEIDLGYELEQSSEHLHYLHSEASSHHHDPSSANDFILYHASMLDTTSELSEMSEIPSSKVADYYQSAGTQMQQSAMPQSSTTLTVNSGMSQQLTLEHHHQSQQPASQAPPPPQQQQSSSGVGAQRSTSHSGALHESSDYVQYHRMNGNGTPVTPSDSNNNPVADISELKATDMSGMLGANVALDPGQPPPSMDHGQLSQSTPQYITSSVGSLMESSTTVVDSSACGQMDGGQAMMTMEQQQQQHPATSQAHYETNNHPAMGHQSNSGNNLLNMMPSSYECYPDESGLQIDESGVGPNGDHHHQSQQSVSSSQSLQAPSQAQQSQQQQQQVQCLSSESAMYHTGLQLQSQAHSGPGQVAMSHHQSTQQHHSITAQDHHHHQQQQQSHPHHYHQSHHSQSQQTHHQLVSTNAQPAPNMEYGQPSQMDLATASIDVASQNTANLQQQQSSSQVGNSSSDNMMQEPMVASASQVELKSECSSYGGGAPPGDYLAHQQQSGTGAAQYHHQQSMGPSVNSVSTSSTSSPVSAIPSSNASSLHHQNLESRITNHHQQQQLHPLPNTAHQRSSHYLPPASTLTSVASSNSSQIAPGASTHSVSDGSDHPKGQTDGANSMLTQYNSGPPLDDPNTTLNSNYVHLKCDSTQTSEIGYSQEPQNNTSGQTSMQATYSSSSSSIITSSQIQSQQAPVSGTSSSVTNSLQMQQQQGHGLSQHQSQQQHQHVSGNESQVYTSQVCMIKVESDESGSSDASQATATNVDTIADPNGTHMTTAQSVSMANYSPNLPPKKIRFSATSSTPSNNASSLQFASKSSGTVSVPTQSQQHQTNTGAQTLVHPTNNYSYNQQPSQQQQQTQASQGSLQNMSNKHFVPNTSSAEQSYHSEGMQHFVQSSMAATSSQESATHRYQPSVTSSVPQSSGSQYVPTQSAVLPPINHLSSSSPPRLVLNNNTSYSIVALQPALPSQTQSGIKGMPQKIVLHSMPATKSGSNGGSSGDPPRTTLISLNTKQINLNTDQMSRSTGGQPSTPVFSQSSGSSIPTGSIILSSIIQNPSGNASGRSGAVTRFAVPLPVTANSINDLRHSPNVTLNPSPAGPVFPFSPGVRPTLIAPAAVITPTLATKSVKGSGQQPIKAPPKNGTSNVAANKGAASTSISAITAVGRSLNPPPLMSDNPAKPFKCSLCGKNLASKNVYQLHLRSHSGEKPFECQMCNNRFSQKTSLTRHMRSHTGERPFPCQICDKRFADKERIKIHMRIHTGEKPFSCSECGKKFSQKSTVKRHMSVHTGVKPFKCDACGKGFANRGNLTAHTKTHQNQQNNNRAQGVSNNNNNNNNNHHHHSQQHIVLQTMQSANQSMVSGNRIPPITNGGSGVNLAGGMANTAIKRININPNNNTNLALNIKPEPIEIDTLVSAPQHNQYPSATMTAAPLSTSISQSQPSS